MTVYALHQLTSVLGPAQVTAMSGSAIAERSWQGRPVETEVDDNTILLLHFPGGTFAVAHGTAAGWTTQQFGAATSTERKAPSTASC